MLLTDQMTTPTSDNKNKDKQEKLSQYSHLLKENSRFLNHWAARGQLNQSPQLQIQCYIPHNGWETGQMISRMSQFQKVLLNLKTNLRRQHPVRLRWHKTKRLPSLFLSHNIQLKNNGSKCLYQISIMLDHQWSAILWTRNKNKWIK